MKKWILLISIWAGSLASFAQSEVAADSLPVISLDGSRYKSFDGFLLDMDAMLVAPPPLIPPQLTYQPYRASEMLPDYNERFRPGSSITYDRVTYTSGTLGFGSLYTGMPTTLQSATFRLNNGLRITTYGEYDAQGRKVKNYQALPWERNNFKGAFEVKSANGNFGIRLEVQRGRTFP